MAAFGKNWRRQLLANAARTWSCAFLHATPNIFAPQPALLTGEALCRFGLPLVILRC
jgi:hypothetical protein